MTENAEDPEVPALPALTAAQAAARLGVKPETLYAYVSRGRLRRRRTAHGSLFDAVEVEAFAQSRRTVAPPSTARGGGLPLMTIDTDVAQMEDDELYVRGVPVADLVDVPFAQVCGWLWTGTEGESAAIDLDHQARAAVRRAISGLPESLGLREQMQVAVTVVGDQDPFRYDFQTASVARMGGAALGAALVALTERDSGSVAERLAERLAGDGRSEDVASLINTALVLLVDHDLAASTMAVRVAASARAHPYAVVTCGLSALASTLHGEAGRAAYRMITERLSGEPLDRILAETVAVHGGVPGFGHRVYRRQDPRWMIMVERLREARPGSRALGATDEIVAAVTSRIQTFPNVDLALAALTLAADLHPETWSVIFALARTAGWIAHAQAEYREPPLRLRPEGRYIGPR